MIVFVENDDSCAAESNADPHGGYDWSADETELTPSARDPDDPCEGVSDAAVDAAPGARVTPHGDDGGTRQERIFAVSDTTQSDAHDPAPAAGTPEGDLWRRLLRAGSMHRTVNRDDGGVLFGGESLIDGTAADGTPMSKAVNTASGISGFSAQVGRRVYFSLASNDPDERRRCAADVVDVMDRFGYLAAGEGDTERWVLHRCSISALYVAMMLLSLSDGVDSKGEPVDGTTYDNVKRGYERLDRFREQIESEIRTETAS